MKDKIVYYFKNDPIKLITKTVLAIMRAPGIRYLISSKFYIKCSYKWRTGEKLNLSNPKSFNEKIQWLKLYDRNPMYTILADKYHVREYVSKTIGDQYLIPLIGVYDNVDDIPWDKLPTKFVLKCNHASGTNIICKDKSKLNIRDSTKKLKKWMKMNYYWRGREWAYKNIKAKIICEKYMVDESGVELKDYKIFCFHGEPKLIQVDYNRFVNHKRNLYDTSWNYIDASIEYPNDSTVHIKKPDKLEEMLELARRLSAGFPHVRVDFYSIAGKIYFGEMTFYPESGYGKFNPKELEFQMGTWMSIYQKREK